MLLQRALRVNPKNAELYKAFFRMEVEHAQSEFKRLKKSEKENAELVLDEETKEFNRKRMEIFKDFTIAKTVFKHATTGKCLSLIVILEGITFDFSWINKKYFCRILTEFFTFSLIIESSVGFTLSFQLFLGYIST